MNFVNVTYKIGSCRYGINVKVEYPTKSAIIEEVYKQGRIPSSQTIELVEVKVNGNKVNL